MGVIVAIVVVIIVVILIGIYCYKNGSVTVYQDHSPSVRPTTNTVYTVPVQPSSTYPPPSYTSTNVALSGTSYRNDAYSGGNDYSSGGNKTDTAFSGTSFR